MIFWVSIRSSVPSGFLSSRFCRLPGKETRYDGRLGGDVVRIDAVWLLGFPELYTPLEEITIWEGGMWRRGGYDSHRIRVEIFVSDR